MQTRISTNGRSACETRLRKDQNAFALHVKRVSMRTKMRVRVSPSPLSGRLKCVCSACETRSHDDLNALASRAKRVRTKI